MTMKNKQQSTIEQDKDKVVKKAEQTDKKKVVSVSLTSAWWAIIRGRVKLENSNNR